MKLTYTADVFSDTVTVHIKLEPADKAKVAVSTISKLAQSFDLPNPTVTSQLKFLLSIAEQIESKTAKSEADTSPRNRARPAKFSY